VKWHQSLTPEKLSERPLEARIGMIQCEISRARNAQASGYHGSTQLALERALELLDLTVETCIRTPALRGLLRWRERIAKAFLFPEDPITDELFRP
jgi:hypothetical protein